MVAALGPVLGGFVTVWTLIGLGYTAARQRLLGESAEKILTGFVFSFSMPALVFSVLSRASLRSLASPALVPVLAGAVIVAGVAAVLQWRLGIRRGEEMAIGAMAAGYLNAGNLGIPIAAQVLGNAALIVPFMLVQLTIMTPAVLLTLDLGTGGGGLLRTLALPLRNPVLIASAAGGLCAATGWRPPSFVLAPVQLLAAAAVTVALFALGLSLAPARSRTAPDTGAGSAAVADSGATAGSRAVTSSGTVAGSEAGARWLPWVVAVLKVVAHPLLAYLIGRYALGLHPKMLQVAVVLAGLPSAQNVFLFAARYHAGDKLARDVVVRSTLLSMVTLVVIALLARP